MRARHRLTEPVEVRFHKARLHLDRSRRALDNGHPLAAMFRIAQAIVNLQKIERRFDAADALL